MATIVITGMVLALPISLYVALILSFHTGSTVSGWSKSNHQGT